MLDKDTKRRIDTCRDILVGKVPDPKSQVEQITVALIYKFMDDMDLEAEELGGERKFFTQDYERYRWAKLVAPGVSGQEMLNIYSEALTKMVENDQLPALFRSIFRNAYLPYRDPETLRSFLREIDSFTYDHSERLGDAFEYLLSVLGSQGDAGQFRTPRHIIDFMVEIIDPKKNEVILDPACGTAGFLISAYKHILKANSSYVVNGNGKHEETDVAEQALESPMRFPGDLLSREDRLRLAGNIKGYDISPDMVRLSLVNLYLHGFADPKVEEYDTLTSEEKWTQTADVILANPPFMSPKGGIKPHTKFRISSKRSEVLFVDYIAEHLNPNGRAAIVVPEGIIFQSQSSYVAIRKMLVDDHLAAVISLPSGVFNPYSGVKTSILILDRSVAKASKHVAFFKIENDGFALGAQRKAVRGSQLAQVKAELGAWLQAARAGGGEELESDLGTVVERSEIAKDGDFNLSAERYRVSAQLETNFPQVPLADLCELVRGVVFSRDDEVASGGVPVLRANNIDRATQSIVLDDVKLVQPKADFSESKKLKAGDIFICLASGSKDHIGKVAFVEADTEFFFGGFMGAIRCHTEKLYPRYLYRMLTDSRFNDFLRQQIAGANINNLGSALLYRYEIPLPPLEVQREIVAEVGGYQRVIDAARAVLGNYRPHIPVDPAWPVVELKEVIRGNPKNGYSGKPVSYPTATKVLTLSATTSGKLDLTKFKYLDEDIAEDAECRCRQNDIYLQRGNTAELVGTAAIFDVDDYGYIFPDLMIRVQADEAKVTPQFLLTVLQAPEARDFLKRNASGSAGSMPKINQSIVNQTPIPLPSIDVQKAIVAEIEAEQALVNGNRDLVARLEKKIDAAIARVWGEAKDEGDA